MADLPAVGADLPLDEEGAIVADLPCVACGYNLRGLSLDGRCPECGMAVERSTRGNLLRFCEPRWVETLASGTNWILASLAASIGVSALSAALVFIGNIPVPWRLIVLPIWLAKLVGFWKLTAPNSGIPRNTGLSAVSYTHLTLPTN